MVDTLTGPPSGADTEENWVNQYDSGPGLNTYYGDVDLGSAIETHGVRVRVFRTANDVNVAGGLGIGLTEIESYSNRAGYLTGTFFYFK